MLSETRTPLRLLYEYKEQAMPHQSLRLLRPQLDGLVLQKVSRAILIKWTRALPASRVLHPCPGRPGRCAGLFLIHAYGEPSLWRGIVVSLPPAK